jgi:hypothetical protein
VIVHLDESEIAKLVGAYPESDYYVPLPEAITQELRRARQGHFNVLHLETGLKADFYPSRSYPYWQWAWERRRQETVEGHAA